MNPTPRHANNEFDGVLPASCGAPPPPGDAAGDSGEGRKAPDLPAEAARGAA